MSNGGGRIPSSIVLITVFGYSLLWGLRKGSTFCMALCVPSLLPTLTHLKEWKEGLRAGINFNLPRVALLTFFGGVLGYAIYSTKNLSFFSSMGKISFTYGYIVIGVLLTGIGVYNLAHSIEEREDIKEGISHPLFRLVKKREFPLLWGLIFSLVCVGEASIALESFILTGSVLEYYTSAFTAVTLGALMMFTFGVGLAIPTVIFTTLSSRWSEDKNRRILNKVRMISSIFMMIFGIIVIIQVLL